MLFKKVCKVVARILRDMHPIWRWERLEARSLGFVKVNRVESRERIEQDYPTNCCSAHSYGKNAPALLHQKVGSTIIFAGRKQSIEGRTVVPRGLT